MLPQLTSLSHSRTVASLRESVRYAARTYGARRKLVALAVLFLVYSVSLQVGFSLYDTLTYPALVWPATGIALAVLYLEGTGLWPAITAGVFLVNVLHGNPLLASLGIAVGNTLQALCGMYLLRVSRFEPTLLGLRNTYILIIVAILTATIGPTVGITMLVLAGTHQMSEVSSIWALWWLGQSLSLLVITPFIMSWFVGTRIRLYTEQTIEWMAAFLLLIGTAYAIFWTPVFVIGQTPFVYLILVPLVWITLRIGPRGTTLALVTITAISICGVILNGNANIGSADRLIQIEFFDCVIAIIFLFFVSSEEGRKQANESLRDYIVQLENALHKISNEDRAKNEFIAVLAHELRNPLATVLSSLEQISVRKVRGAELDELVGTMNDRVHTMARLLDDLLDTSRISQKKFKLQKETVDLIDVLRKSIETASQLIRNRNHELVLLLPNGPLWLQADPMRLEQVVVNLLNNAAKYTEIGGTITLTCRSTDRSIIVSVKDTGIGIAKEMLPRIFEPFVQVEKGKRSEGLGLGLSLSKRLIEMHQGTIMARSAGLNTGSEFIVELPLPAAVQLPIPVTSRLRQYTTTTHDIRSVLVVDDNTLAAEGLGKLLAHKGYVVKLAFDAASALATARAFKPDAVLLDIGLPDMSGYEVAKRLRQSGEHQSFMVALTGYGQEEDRMEANRAGFDHHLTKPVSLADVENVLVRAMKKTG